MTRRSPRARRAVAAAAACVVAMPGADVRAEGPCHAAPLGDRVLYLRGSLNDWRADDDAAFRWACDRYELLVKAPGTLDFKVADEDWAADADFGAAPSTTLASGASASVVAKGAAFHASFTGVERVTLIPHDGGAPTLRIDDLPADTALPAPAGATLDDPLARSLAFDSRALADKTPFGAVVPGTEVAFSLGALPGVESVTLVVERRRLEGDQNVLEYTELARVPLARAAAADGRERWSGRFRFPSPAVYGWWFEVRIGGRTYVMENNAQPVYWTRERGTGGAGVAAEMPASRKRIRRFRQTVYAADFHVPDWAQDAVFYDIFPERFRNGDPRNDPKPGVDRYQDKDVEFHTNWNDRPYVPHSGDGSDDVYNNDFFGGDIAGIIDKLDEIRALGANTLYITPMFTAASNHKYDTADYKHIDPHFGSDADFARLCAEAAKRGIRVIPDTSLNHTGADSIYFDRFGTRGGHGAFEGGHIDPTSPYTHWYTFDAAQKDPDKQFKGWGGTTDLPELDKADASFRDFAYRAPDSVMKTWLDRGAAGWRMDVAPWIADDFWREWRTEVKHHAPEALTISETWFDASKFLLGDEFDSTMNYIFRGALIDYANGGDARAAMANLELVREEYPPPAFGALLNLLSSHDTPRALHLFGDVDGQATPAQVALAKRKLLLATFFQMTYPGMPAIFYGDEVGVTGGADPLNRATYPWPDLGGHPDVALHDAVARLVHLRDGLPVLRRGALLAPLHVDAHVVVLARRLGDAWAIVATNNDDVPQQVTVVLPADAPAPGWVDALAPGAAVDATSDRTLTLTVPGRFGTVLTAASATPGSKP